VRELCRGHLATKTLMPKLLQNGESTVSPLPSPQERRLTVIDLKYDDCNVPGEWQDDCNFCNLPPNSTCNPPRAGERPLCKKEDDGSSSKTRTRYARMGDALKKQSHPILYAMCNGGKAGIQNWGESVAHSWRSTDDIQSKTWPLQTQ